LIEVGQKKMTARTQEVAKRLVGRGWMVDYAPGDEGEFFRVVVNYGTEEKSLERLVRCIVEVGADVVANEDR
jgi:glutamate decarboxylase